MIVVAHLVHLVQQHQRVANTRLLQSGDNATRHCSDVGSSVTADLRLIMDAAQADAHILLLQCAGNRAGD